MTFFESSPVIVRFVRFNAKLLQQGAALYHHVEFSPPGIVSQNRSLPSWAGRSRGAHQGLVALELSPSVVCVSAISISLHNCLMWRERSLVKSKARRLS